MELEAHWGDWRTCAGLAVRWPRGSWSRDLFASLSIPYRSFLRSIVKGQEPMARSSCNGNSYGITGKFFVETGPRGSVDSQDFQNLLGCGYKQHGLTLKLVLLWAGDGPRWPADVPCNLYFPMIINIMIFFFFFFQRLPEVLFSANTLLLLEELLWILNQEVNMTCWSQLQLELWLSSLCGKDWSHF